MDDRRAALEAIAYGGDARITPGDRLKALEQLGTFGGGATCPVCTAADEFVDADIDLDMLAADVLTALLEDRVILDVDPARLTEGSRGRRTGV